MKISLSGSRYAWLLGRFWFAGADIDGSHSRHKAAGTLRSRYDLQEV